MDYLRVGKPVRQVIMLCRGPTGTLEPTVLYEDQGKRKKKKKQTRVLRPLERVARRLTKAQSAYWDTLAERHDRSNQKKRDGWARDGITNVGKAIRKAGNQIRRGF